MATNKGLAPHARQERLVIQELPDEVLVYDLDRDVASCLNQTAARVWKHCDGKTSVPEIARRVGKELSGPVDEKMVWYALDQLGKSRLLDERVELPASLAKLTRRQFLAKMGVAAAVGIPAIIAITAPEPAEAATCLPLGAPCSSDDQCCSGTCSATLHTCSSGPGLRQSRSGSKPATNSRPWQPESRPRP